MGGLIPCGIAGSHPRTVLAAFAEAELEFISPFWLSFSKDVSVAEAGLSDFVGVTICDSLLSTLKDYFFRGC